ncbi:MAG: hypothetical protein DBY05_07675 [Clostridiales bacterium]|nr:MAG: hypothetical protein DBY05_07675 [Clostridiales bacterium]
MNRYMQMIARIIAVLISAVIIAVTGYSVPAVPVFAETENEYDYTKVEDDLNDVDLSLYPIDAAGNPAIASFVEYCYTPNVWKNGNYALYLYVYNPSQKEFSLRAGAHQINIATKYGDDGKPAEYKLLSLKLCGHTTEKYDKLIYKFRVEHVEEIYANAKAYEEKYGYRRYDVSNLLLYELGASAAEKSTVGKEYRYTGYAKGYSEESATKSTLECEWKKAEVYEANVSHTNYRMESEYKDHTRHEVNTVYFSVPDEYITDYGNLQGIRAQWYEYVTSPIFVTEDAGAYAALSDYVGVNIGEKNEALKWSVLWHEKTTTPPLSAFFRTYNNQGYGLNGPAISSGATYTPEISWLFSTNGIDHSEYQLSRYQVETWARSYASAYGKEADILGRYSSELFAEGIDTERIKLLENPEAKRGLIVRDFDANDEFNLLSYDDTHSGWEAFVDYICGKKVIFGDGVKYSPIEEITPEKFTGNKAADCKNLLLNEDDYDEFSAAFTASQEAGEHLFVFRFAQTDYYSSPAYFDSLENSSFTNEDGYVAQQTVFLDFTMIHLKFVKDETETIIPVAMNPIDIWNAVDPPIDTQEDWLSLLKKIGMAILGIAGLIFVAWLLTLFFPIVWTVIKAIFKALWWIISAPFKAIGNAINNKKKK